MKADEATAEVFFAALKALKISEREALFEKIVSDPRIREDLIDMALIEEAKKTSGKTVSAKAYFAKRRKAKDAV